MPTLGLVELDRHLPARVGLDPLHVPPEEGVDRCFDRVGVEPKRRGDRGGGAGIA